MKLFGTKLSICVKTYCINISSKWMCVREGKLCQNPHFDMFHHIIIIITFISLDFPCNYNFYWRADTSSCYSFNTSKLSYVNASKACGSANSSLANLETKEEYYYIKKAIRDLGRKLVSFRGKSFVYRGRGGV